MTEVLVLDQAQVHEFEGRDHGGAGVSFILVDAEPGSGPSLHRHP